MVKADKLQFHTEERVMCSQDKDVTMRVPFADDFCLQIRISLFCFCLQSLTPHLECSSVAARAGVGDRRSHQKASAGAVCWPPETVSSRKGVLDSLTET